MCFILDRLIISRFFWNARDSPCYDAVIIVLHFLQWLSYILCKYCINIKSLPMKSIFLLKFWGRHNIWSMLFIYSNNIWVLSYRTADYTHTARYQHMHALPGRHCKRLRSATLEKKTCGILLQKFVRVFLIWCRISLCRMLNFSILAYLLNCNQNDEIEL